jgi:3-hydroxyacyl-CoA dehydrogenase/enoyl-CoA hydratase/3-hydroxybutyryl-CoA epimerase
MTAVAKYVEEGIAWLEIDLPGEPVNKITRGVRDELAPLLDGLRSDDTIRAAVLISAKSGSFIAGADIDEFVALKSRDEALSLVTLGQALLTKLTSLGKPVVAAVDGACLGGGLETALACTYRIATDDPKTRIGLPEVQLGILPAAGGCQRLPRLIGLRRALDLILTGKQLPGKRAHRAGMVDELVHPAILRPAARKAALRLAEGWRPRRGRGGITELALEKNPVGRKVVFKTARKQVLKRTGGHYPAPLAALRAVEHGLTHGISAGLDMEAAEFAELAVGDVSRKLVQIFFATTALKKDPGVEGEAPHPKVVDNLAIIGAGFMGAGIGGVAVSQAGVDVRFRDTDLRAVGRGVRAARRILENRLKRRRITKPEYRRLVRLLSGGTDWAGFRRADLLIEAVFEDLEIKRQVLREAERWAREDSVLASNTSTIPIARIAEALSRPERVIGMHFFSPVEKMPLLEVIVTDQTTPLVTVTAVAFGRAMGKTVIVVRDCPGFWVNRILAPYMNEAGRLLEEGVTIETIDGAMTKFGFPVGPITLLDEVGLDVAQKASGVLHEAFGPRLRPMEGLHRMTDDGRLGRKNGRGFYRYEQGKKRGVDEAVYEIIGAAPDPEVPSQDIVKRLIYAMLNEAARALAEGVVRSPRDGDIGAIFGIGFPPFRGGPLRYLDDIGAAKTVETLDQLATRYGDRFAAAPVLRQLAERGGQFHPET